MSKEKKKVRELFRSSVFERDGHKCRVCAYKPGLPLDAHHITPREIMPAGGYVKENGISLCFKCHIYAEACLENSKQPNFEVSLKDYNPEKLYELISSSYEKAFEACKKLASA